jgi:hypothetical protein
MIPETSNYSCPEYNMSMPDCPIYESTIYNPEVICNQETIYKPILPIILESNNYDKTEPICCPAKEKSEPPKKLGPAATLKAEKAQVNIKVSDCLIISQDALLTTLN